MVVMVVMFRDGNYAAAIGNSAAHVLELNRGVVNMKTVGEKMIDAVKDFTAA